MTDRVGEEGVHVSLKDNSTVPDMTPHNNDNYGCHQPDLFYTY